MMTDDVGFELRPGEKEITVHIEQSDRIANGVAIEFRQVTSPGAA